MKSLLRALFLLLPVLFIAPAGKGSKAFSGFPQITLWAWQMPERLDSLDPRYISVAYLDQTIYVRNSVMAEPRVQPMSVAPGTQVIAVARIEMPAGFAPDSEETRSKVVAALLRSARRDGVAALQVDFDAAKSQREFYRDVLTRLRRQMPAAMPLSITALASWCAFDDWIAKLPIDEAVPMMFRMGIDGRQFGSRNPAQLLREPLCMGSLGVSTDEPWPEVTAGKHLYVFHGRPWNPETVEAVMRKTNR